MKTILFMFISMMVMGFLAGCDPSDDVVLPKSAVDINAPVQYWVDYTCANNFNPTVNYDNRDLGKPEAAFFFSKELTDAKISPGVLEMIPTESDAKYSDGKYVWQVHEVEAAEWAKRMGITAQVAIQGECALPLVLEQALFRVTQEALANVARHSGAKQVDLHIAYSSHSVTLTITDNGCGFNLAEAVVAGFGLSTMRQRMVEQGGTLTINTQPEGGTTVIAYAPL